MLQRRARRLDQFFGELNSLDFERQWAGVHD